MSEWLKETGCKPVGYAYAGSNPAPPTTLANLNDPHFDEPREQEGFRARRARVGHQVGSERLGMSQWEVPPGQAAYPYHLHLMEEELLIVLEGAPALRTPDGWRDLAEGEIVLFPRGEQGAHQLVNRTDATVRFVAISTHGDPDVVIYPDSDKVGVAERRSRGGGLREFFRRSAAVDYYDGERPPSE
jgi:uncharacterized cupin superfamily protein